MTRGGASTLAGAALLVAVVTVAARALGFGRWVVFAQTVEGGCLGDVYNTANLLPNVMFEVVVGGALAGMVVPVLAGAVARDDRAAVNATISALLTWTMLLLLPVAVGAAIAARPMIDFFLGNAHECPQAVDVGERMLLIFIPQLFCYGVAVVLSGALAAHRRFLAAALAPLMSSLVLIATYLIFAGITGSDLSTTAVDPRAGDVLAVGTTMGVFALALTVVVPLRAAGITVRPTLAFPDGVAHKVRALALAGAAVLIAQHCALLVVNWLANNHGAAGSVTAWTWALAVFLSAHAILALPIVTSAFPRIAAAADPGPLTARTTRLVVLAGCGGAALTAGAAVPISRVFIAGTQVSDRTTLRDGIIALAPALIGWAVLTHLSRVLYAAHQGRSAAVATVAGWVVAAAGGVVGVALTDERNAVAALAGGYTVGLTVGAAVMLVVVARLHGAAALAGLGRTGAVGIGAACVSAAVGALVGARFDDAGFAAALGGTLAVTGVIAGIFGALVLAGDRTTLVALRGGSDDE